MGLKEFSDSVDAACFGSSEEFDRIINWRLYPLPDPNATPRHSKG